MTQIDSAGRACSAAAMLGSAVLVIDESSVASDTAISTATRARRLPTSGAAARRVRQAQAAASSSRTSASGSVTIGQWPVASSTTLKPGSWRTRWRIAAMVG